MGRRFDAALYQLDRLPSMREAQLARALAAAAEEPHPADCTAEPSLSEFASTSEDGWLAEASTDTDLMATALGTQLSAVGDVVDAVSLCEAARLCDSARVGSWRVG